MKNAKNMKKISIISAVIAFIAAGIYFFTSQNYPVAFVGGSPIFNGDFQKSYLISRNFYANSLKAGSQDAVILKSNDVETELKRATLEVLIGQKIINEELEKMMKPEDLSTVINEKIGAIDLDSGNFKKGSELLYGTSAENVKNLVLIPKAKEEIFEGRMILENSKTDLDGWLKRKKEETNVEILIPGFYWNKGEVAIK